MVGSGIRKKPIPDPGVKKVPDPGFGSATLLQKFRGFGIGNYYSNGSTEAKTGIDLHIEEGKLKRWTHSLSASRLDHKEETIYTR